jgi:hypothetical protein
MYAFRDNTDLILQFNILDYPDAIEAKKVAVLLMGTGVRVAGEHWDKVEWRRGCLLQR